MANYIDLEIRHSYFKWLCSLIDEENHLTLMRHLNRRPFYWSVPNDDNRAADGQLLRELFMEDNTYTDYTYPEDDFSILETLISIAVRINDMVAKIDEEDRVAFWFWKLISNLKLDVFSDDDIFEYGGIRKIDQILDKWLDRKYEKNGEGGIFPLKKTDEDQRKVEIWYQMSAYLDEIGA